LIDLDLQPHSQPAKKVKNCKRLHFVINQATAISYLAKNKAFDRQKSKAA
jgi:hypothetical protein